MTTRVSAHLLHAAFQIAGENDVRFYLNGVYVTPHKDGGVLLTATNGVSAVFIHDVNGYTDVDVIVARFKITAKDRKAKSAITVLNFIDHRFPSMGHLIPEFPKNQKPVLLNATLIMPFQHVATAFNSSHHEMALHCNGAGPTFVTFGNAPALGVIMPLREKFVGTPMTDFPDFMKQ